jgi:hypothetical protein
MISEFEFPNGIQLLQRWQDKDLAACERLTEIFDKTIDGQYDHIFHGPAPRDRVHISGPVDLLSLTIMFRLYGIEAAEFYKEDAERFVRTSLMTQRLMGMPKHYISWPVYGFTAEALGQTMIYSDQFSPGADPDKPLFNHDNWREVKTPDLSSGIPKLLDEVVDCYHRLTGLQPVLHLCAPYSTAADTFGQEAIISEITHNPEFANRFLDLISDKLLEPWINHFFDRYPAGWVELSDASGSPFFIGPQNCKNIAIRASKRLKDRNTWGDRVYDANYRGDYVTRAIKATAKVSRRRKKQNTDKAEMSLEELFQVKYSVCPDYVIRLAEDRIPLDFYEQQAIKHNIPLFLGIGATQVDRNSIADLDTTRSETEKYTRDYVDAIKRVANQVVSNGYESRDPPWPGAIYFEDISAESSFELIKTILATALGQGELPSATFSD